METQQHATMDFFNSRYFRINKFFLCAIGLWPYQQPTIKFISLSFAIVNSMMATLPQVYNLLQTITSQSRLFREKIREETREKCTVKYTIKYTIIAEITVAFSVSQKRWSRDKYKFYPSARKYNGCHQLIVYYQVAYFFEYWYRVDEMFEIMPTLCAATICFWKVTSLAYNSKKVGTTSQRRTREHVFQHVVSV